MLTNHQEPFKSTIITLVLAHYCWFLVGLLCGFTVHMHILFLLYDDTYFHFKENSSLKFFPYCCFMESPYGIFVPTDPFEQMIPLVSRVLYSIAWNINSLACLLQVSHFHSFCQLIIMEKSFLHLYWGMKLTKYTFY